MDFPTEYIDIALLYEGTYIFWLVDRQTYCNLCPLYWGGSASESRNPRLGYNTGSTRRTAFNSECLNNGPLDIPAPWLLRLSTRMICIAQRSPLSNGTLQPNTNQQHTSSLPIIHSSGEHHGSGQIWCGDRKLVQCVQRHCSSTSYSILILFKQHTPLKLCSLPPGSPLANIAIAQMAALDVLAEELTMLIELRLLELAIYQQAFPSINRPRNIYSAAISSYGILPIPQLVGMVLAIVVIMHCCGR